MSGGYRRYLAIVLAVLLNVVWGFGSPASATKVCPDARSNASIAHSRHHSMPNTRFGVQGAGAVQDFAAERMGDYLTVFYDGRLLTSPMLREAIPISNRAGGLRVLAQAGRAADMPNAGDVSVVFKVVMTRD